VTGRRVVVTGMGVIAPNGNDVESFVKALEEGRSAVGPITRFDASAYPTRIAAAVPDPLIAGRCSLFATGQAVGDEQRSATAESRHPIPDTHSTSSEERAASAQRTANSEQRTASPAANRDRITRFALEASIQAINRANLKDIDPAAVGVLIAAGFGSYDHEEVFTSCAAGLRDGGFDWSAFREQFQRTVKPRPLERRTPGSVPTFIAQHFGFGGPVMAVMTACAAGTQALGDAARWIRTGDCDVVVAGGADSELYPMGLASFCLLHALSRRNDEPQRASRPFSASRDGFVLGEGAGVLVLEELEHARSRGAAIHAEILGFGSACDSYRVTDPHPDGTGAMLAMERALKQARLAPDDVDYLNAHGTSTPLNDRIEARAIRRLFGDDGRVAVTSTKSMIGHLTVAAGAVEAIATIAALERQIAQPTINLDDPDADCCGLDFIPHEARPMDIDVALSNSFAFGGQCASILLGRAPQ
jgi:3-oxoacyl-[acyl-carrier-protein] synthase II